VIVPMTVHEDSRTDVPADVAQRGDRFAVTRVQGRERGSNELGATPERQFELAFDALARRVEAAGLTLAEIGRITVFTPDRSFRPLINGPWLALFPNADRPARKTTHADLGEGVHVELAADGVRGAAREQIEIEGIAHKDPLPMAVRMGRYLFSSVIPADVPGGGTVHGVDAIHQVFANMQAVVEAAGATQADVQNVWVYLGMWDLHDDMVDTWVASFPDEHRRPTRKTFWYPSVSIQLQMEAVLGDERRVVEIDGLPHRDPIPMAAVCDGLFTTSGVDGRDPATGRVPRGVPAQSSLMLRNLDALLAQVGGSADDLFHVTALVGSRHYIPHVQAAWGERFADGGPALQFLELGLVARDMLVQVIAEGVVSDGWRAGR
jgi:2-iminobutanoate/2-iminopropanoate deaminase